MSDKMVPLAIIISRSEAIVMASMLEAADIIVHVGGLHHASVAINSVALGHYRLMVAECQYGEASAIIADSFAASEYCFSEGLQTAVIKLFLAWAGSIILVTGATMLYLGTTVIGHLWLLPLSFISTPVNPQGRSEYFLAAPRAQ
jgi:hypothetical protein